MSRTPRTAVPLSAVQAGIWLADRRESADGAGGADGADGADAARGVDAADAGAAYRMPLAVRLRGRLDVAALEAACRTLLDRHPVLAGAVTERDGEPLLVPGAAAVDLARRGTPHPDAVAAEIGRPFDVATGPLVRLTLWEETPGDHLLLLVAHHLVFDGTSKDVVLAELAAAYAGTAADLPPPPDAAAVAERGADALARDTEAARAFWAARWAGPVPVELPRGAVGAVPPADAGGAVAVPVDADTWGGLDAFATTLGATRFELLLAAWTALLARYGTAEPVVAVDLGTRGPEERAAVGAFVTELPVTVPTALTGTVAEHVGAVRAALRAVYPFRRVPLARAVPGLRPGPAPTPVTMSYRRRAAPPVFPGLDVEVTWAMPAGPPRSDVHLQVVDGPDGPSALLGHRPEALARVDAGRVAGHLATLLSGMVSGAANPTAAGARLADLPLLGPDERARLGRDGTGPAAPDTAPTIGDAFAAQAGRTPDRPALVGAGRTRSYAELAERADDLAGRLRAIGVGPGDVVGVRMGRSPDLVVALLGVLTAGAAYLPLDPDHPAERLEALTADAGVRALVGEGLACAPVGPAAGRPLREPDPDVAYVMYTSGSTGRPKGVAVRHRSVLNLIASVRELVGGDSPARWLAATAFGFDISVLELLGPLVAGDTVVLAVDAEVRDPAALRDLATGSGVTHVQATPSGWRALLDAGFADPGVTALCGGEALPADLAARLRPRVRTLTNVYGPTETTIWSTAAALGGAKHAADGGAPPIGRPLHGTSVRVVDATWEPVPVGVTGELWIGGVGVARGYLGRPGLTASRFVPDPDGDGDRAYRTGDLVRWTDDGVLRFGGRADDQVKVRGHRVEPGEVEAALARCVGVAAAVAAARVDATDGHRLVAWVVPEPGASPDPTALRAEVAGTLPGYLVPSVVGVVDRLPLTPNGKLDRRALPDPEPPRPGSPAAPPTGGDGSPDGGTRDEVAAIWREVLGVERVGPDDDLFDLGGHSLTVTRIVARLRERLGVDLPLHVLYDAPTLAGMSDAVGDALAGARS